MGALFDFKCTCDSTLVYICQADAEKCIFVWTILSQTPRRTPQVTSDAGRISARIFWLFPKERRMLRKRDYQGRLSFHFFDRWMTDLATHRQKKVQAMSWKNLQMLEFCHFTWSWMGPINCAPNPIDDQHGFDTLSFRTQKCSHITVAVNVLRPFSNGMNMRGVCLQNHPPLD